MAHLRVDVLGNSSLTLIGDDIDFDPGYMLSANQVRLRSSDDGSGSVGQDAGHTIVANRVVAGEPGSSFGSVDLLGASNQIRALSFDAYDVVFNNANSGYQVDLSGTASTLNVVAHSGVTQSGPIAADYFTLITSDTSPDSGTVVLTDSANQIRTLGFSVGSHIRVNTGGDLLVAPFIDPFSTFVPPEAGGDISLRATGTFTMDGDLRAGIVAGPSLIDVGGAGFVNYYGGRLLTSGGRFVVRSTNYTLDDYGFIQFGTGGDEFNFVVFAGYPGPEPTTGNGLFTNLVGQLQINPADLGIVSRAYDGTTTITLSRTRIDTGNGVDATVSLPGSNIPSLPVIRYSVSVPGDFDNPNAGTDKAFTLPPSKDTSAIGDNSDGTRLSYYGLSTPSYRRNAGPSTITPISVVHASAVDLSGLMAQDKVYDGTTVATLTGVPVINAAPGDDVALAGEFTASFLDKNVGVGKPVTLAGFSLVGADAGNYTITPPTGLSASITAAPLFLTGLTAANKVYDTTVSATLSGIAAVNALGTDSLTLSGTPAGVFLDKHVGVAKPVQVTGLVLGGSDAGNYVLASSNSLAADITPAPLLVTGLAVADKVYDATTLATLSGAASVIPLGGDQVSVVSLGVANFNDKNVGQAKPVTLSAFALAGTDSGNYTLVAPTGLLASITPADLAITGGVVATKVYDATTLATLSAAPVVNGLSADEVRLSATLSASFADKNVGNAKLVTLTGAALEGADAGNYRLLPPGTLTGDITPAMLALAGVSVADKVYDASTSVPLVGTPSVTPIGSDVVSVTGTGVASVADKNVGSGKPVTVTGFALAGTDAPNYSLVFPTGLTANTTPRPIAPAGIVAIDRITEGPASGNVDVDLDLSNAGVVGVLPGDTVALVTNAAKGVVDSPDPGANKPVTVLGLALSGPDAFNYALSAVRDVNSPVVTLIPSLNLVFEGIRFREYLQAVSDAQEPFRRAMAEALAAGFGKENIRKRLALGLVFETGLAAPAIEDIQPAMGPASCTLAGVGSSLACP